MKRRKFIRLLGGAPAARPKRFARRSPPGRPKVVQRGLAPRWHGASSLTSGSRAPGSL
jgi:hypothetical protein